MPEFGFIQRDVAQSMGNLIRMMKGATIVQRSGSLVTMESGGEDTLALLSVEVPYTAGGRSSVSVTRCGKNLASINSESGMGSAIFSYNASTQIISVNRSSNQAVWLFHAFAHPIPAGTTVSFSVTAIDGNIGTKGLTFGGYTKTPSNAWTTTEYMLPRSTAFSNNVYSVSQAVSRDTEYLCLYASNANIPAAVTHLQVQFELGGTVTAYEPYSGETWTRAMPSGFYGGTVGLTAGTVTSRYASDGTELATPVVTSISPVSATVADGVNNIWANTGDVTVGWREQAGTYYPAQWYSEILAAWNSK